MRLLSATLRHYRVHRELTVEFDPSRTLIGGPNEGGKSTLVEAIHRALFLKARGQTEHHRAMVSTRHGGQPEVEVAFEAEGQRFLVRKRFGGNGTATLTRMGAPTLQGEAAEAELARLLGVAPGASRKDLPSQWSHLWVWQGSSGGDPSDSISPQSDRLLSRLQSVGGAAALQSDLDARVAALFAAEVERLFKQNGDPRGTTELAAAHEEEAQARTALERAGSRREQLVQSVRDHEDASRDLQRLDAEQPALSAQQRALAERAARLSALRAREASEQSVSTAAAERLRTLADAGERLTALRRQLAGHDSQTQPATQRARELTETRNATAARAEEAERVLQDTRTSVRRQRQERDRLQAGIRRLEAASRLAELTRHRQQVEQHRQEARHLRDQIAALPSITEARLRRIRDLDRAVSRTESAWKAASTGIEVLKSGLPVEIAGERLDPGDARILTEDTEIGIGSDVRLRIRPGGGSSLSDARAAALDAREQLAQELDAAGVKTTHEAHEAAARREELSNRLKTAEQLLQSLDADRLDTQVEAAAAALTAAEAEWTRRSEGASESPPCSDPAAVRASLDALTEALSTAEREENRRQAERDAAHQSAAQAASNLTRHSEELERTNREADAWRGQIRLLEELHGEDATREAALRAARESVLSATLQLNQTRAELAQLQPELLEADGARLERALNAASERRTDATRRLAVAQAALRNEGTEDPEAEWSLAAARATTAREHLDSLQTRARSIQRLDQLFREEQKALADQLTRPLAERIAGYLQCIFGAGARAEVSLIEGTLGGLQLVRPATHDASVAFADLSGGTREQVAAAVRLATAEILAADHEGVLPVIFDDAFAYSDPDRVQVLQRMLDLAAVRGLQVIVLTCTPTDYAALGARSLRLGA
ncbi:MAG: AAA family ATPase [Verrucomicrobiales bacterium]|nr:AAA family ATPase [Verrucomicrobiales bacterium]